MDPGCIRSQFTFIQQQTTSLYSKYNSFTNTPPSDLQWSEVNKHNDTIQSLLRYYFGKEHAFFSSTIVGACAADKTRRKRTTKSTTPTTTTTTTDARVFPEQRVVAWKANSGYLRPDRQSRNDTRKEERPRFGEAQRRSDIGCSSTTKNPRRSHGKDGREGKEMQKEGEICIISILGFAGHA